MVNVNKIWNLMAQFRPALIAGCILCQNLLMMTRLSGDQGQITQIGAVKTFENLRWVYRQPLILMNMMRW